MCQGRRDIWKEEFKELVGWVGRCQAIIIITFFFLKKSPSSLFLVHVLIFSHHCNTKKNSLCQNVAATLLPHILGTEHMTKADGADFSTNINNYKQKRYAIAICTFLWNGYHTLTRDYCRIGIVLPMDHCDCQGNRRSR